MKISTIQENFFTKIAKMIASFQISRLPDDPKLKQALEDMRRSNEEAAVILHNFCKRNPDDPICKDKRGSK